MNEAKRLSNHISDIAPFYGCGLLQTPQKDFFWGHENDELWPFCCCGTPSPSCLLYYTPLRSKQSPNMDLHSCPTYNTCCWIFFFFFFKHVTEIYRAKHWGKKSVIRVHNWRLFLLLMSRGGISEDFSLEVDRYVLFFCFWPTIFKTSDVLWQICTADLNLKTVIILNQTIWNEIFNGVTINLLSTSMSVPWAAQQKVKKS